jgi:phospholipase C
MAPRRIADEHGGCFDHVPPPVAKPPSEAKTAPFHFNRFGVRVPAVIVSPYVKAGSVIRPPTTTPYDHTSIIATLRKRLRLARNHQRTRRVFLNVIGNQIGPLHEINYPTCWRLHNVDRTMLIQP